MTPPFSEEGGIDMEQLLAMLNQTWKAVGEWQFVSDVLALTLLGFTCFYLLVLLFERRKREYMLKMHLKRNPAQKLGDRFKSVEKFYREIDEFLTEKGHGNVADIFFYGVVIVSLVIFVAMLFTGQIVLAVGYPLAFIWFIRKMFRISRKDPVVEMEEEMPAMIDNMIRVFTKYSDIRTIVYETSLMTEGKLQAELDFLSRQMNSKNPRVVLEEWSEKYNSVWLNSFGFTLIGYLDDTSKEETIQNLRHLRNILEKENTAKKDAIKQRKPSLIINYSLAVIAVVLGIMNIIFNPIAFDFFFHTYLGLFCFTAGFGFVLGTIYMNIRMMKIEK